jgi:hypothetical protein
MCVTHDLCTWVVVCVSHVVGEYEAHTDTHRHKQSQQSLTHTPLTHTSHSHTHKHSTQDSPNQLFSLPVCPASLSASVCHPPSASLCLPLSPSLSPSPCLSLSLSLPQSLKQYQAIHPSDSNEVAQRVHCKRCHICIESGYVPLFIPYPQVRNIPILKPRAAPPPPPPPPAPLPPCLILAFAQSSGIGRVLLTAPVGGLDAGVVLA